MDGVMKKMNGSLHYLLVMALVFTMTSCGYTNKMKLSHNIKSIYVETALNKISIEQMYSYQPGLEMDITNAVISRFQTDGNLKIAKADQADAILSNPLKE